MKILIAAGAFKQSLTAAEVCAAILSGLRQSDLRGAFEVLPIADGGNGTLDAFLAGGGQRFSLQVLDPLLRPVQAEYGLIDSGTTAIIEMARSSGLELLQPAELNPLIASTYGTGQLMLDALERGAGRMILGLGGSATVDGGMGCMSALGVRLLDAAGDEIGPGGAGLADISRIDRSKMDKRWRDIEITIASDVETPTLGRQRSGGADFRSAKGRRRRYGRDLGAEPAPLFQHYSWANGNRSAGHARGRRRWRIRGWTYRVFAVQDRLWHRPGTES